MIPVGLPPGVSAEQAQQVIAFLRANPELAKQTANNVKQMYEQNPTAMANMMRYQNSVGREAIAAKMAELKEDPELKPLYDDLAANGPGALKKYYDDPKWCDLVSAKFGDLEALGGDNMVPAVRAPPPPRPVAGPCPPVHQLTTLHDAAKFDCVEALEKVLGEDAVNAALKVDAPDKRAATALHIAAAFGSVNAATFLLDKGASIDLCDPRGNAALHYAAGYGQPELVELLVARGADVTLQNAQLQTPRDAARANGHGPIVAALSAVMEKAAAAPAPAANADRPHQHGRWPWRTSWPSWKLRCPRTSYARGMEVPTHPTVSHPHGERPPSRARAYPPGPTHRRAAAGLPCTPSSSRSPEVWYLRSISAVSHRDRGKPLRQRGVCEARTPPSNLGFGGGRPKKHHSQATEVRAAFRCHQPAS